MSCLGSYDSRLTRFIYIGYLTGMVNKSRKISRIVNAFQKAEKKLRFFARRNRKVNGAYNVKDTWEPPEQVWASTLPNQDAVWDSDDDNDSMNTAQRERQRIKVGDRVAEWLQGCGGDPITLGVDEKELATLYNTSVEEEPWPEHLLDVKAPPLWALGNEVPTFAQLEFKRQLALSEAQEMGWEIRLEDTPVRGMEPVQLDAGDW